MTVSRRTLLGAALAAPLALAACGTSAGSRRGVIRLVTPDFAGTDGRQVLEDEILSSFARTDVATIVDYTAWDRLNEKLTTGIASGIIPDAIMMGVGWVPPFADKGVFGALPDDLFDELGINPALRPVAEFDGRVHGVPYAMEGRMLVTNRRILAEAGIDAPPTTLEELREVCRELQGLVPMSIDLFSNNIRQTWIHILACHGGALFSPDGRELAFDDGSGAEALQYLLDLVDDGSADFNRRVAPGQPRPWQREEAAIDLTSSGEWPNLSEQTPDLITPEAMDLFLMPGAQGHDAVLFLGGTLVSPSAVSPNAEAVTELIRHMFDRRLLLAAGTVNGKLPPVDDLPPDPDFEANRIGTFAVDNLDSAGAFEGGSAAWMEIREQVAPQLEAAMGRAQSVQQTIDNLARISQVALDRLR